MSTQVVTPSVLAKLQAQGWYMALEPERIVPLAAGMLETAYHRHLATADSDPEEAYWNVTQRRSKAHPLYRAFPQHDHRVAADSLVLAGLLMPHPGNNGRQSRFALSPEGVAYVEAHREEWASTLYYGKRGNPDRLARYLELVDEMAGRFGAWPLPEVERAWWGGEVAFETWEKRRRLLFHYRSLGYRGAGWMEDQHYHYDPWSVASLIEEPRELRPIPL